MLLLLACAPSPGDTGPRLCNGSADLCDRSLADTTFLMTHNAMSSADDGWLSPNQTHDVPRQLADGVRGISFDTHQGDDGEALLCHAWCELGSQPLVDGLAEIDAFLRDNPDEVVLMDFEAYVSAEVMAQAFEESGLLDHVYAHTLGQDWPTLGQLVDDRTRLVVFSDDGGDPAWYHDTWVHTWGTTWAYETTDEFDCELLRGEPGNALFQVNHFLTAPLASPDLAAQANPLLESRLLDCWKETGQRPVVVLVDFYDREDPLTAVDAINARLSP